MQFIYRIVYFKFNRKTANSLLNEKQFDRFVAAPTCKIVPEARLLNPGSPTPSTLNSVVGKSFFLEQAFFLFFS